MVQLTVFILSAASLLLHPTDGIESVPEIHFVIIDKLMEWSFALPPTATLMDLQKAVALEWSLQYPFEVRLLGETIVSARSASDENISSNPNIRFAWKLLSDFWSVSVGFRIPLTVHHNADTQVYFSLLRMLAGCVSNEHKLEWFQFIQQCAQSKLCSVQDLCDKFKDHFSCYNGELKWIGLSGRTLRGTIDLSFLPSTVTKMDLEHNLLTRIYGLDRLAGKQLASLKIKKNPLEIDLQPFVRSDSSKNNPLRFIWVNLHQICGSLHESGYTQRKEPGAGDGMARVNRVVGKWINYSILDHLYIGWKESGRHTRQKAFAD